MQQGDWDRLMQDFAGRVRSTNVLPVVHKAFGAKPLVGQEPEREPFAPPGPEPRPAVQTISRAKAQRIEEIVLAAAHAALRRLASTGRAHRQAVFAAIEHAVKQQCASILKAAAISPKQLSAIETARTQWWAEQKTKGKEIRRALSVELRGARAKLRRLNETIVNADAEAEKRVAEHSRELRRTLAGQLINARTNLKRLRSEFETGSRSAAAAAIARIEGDYPSVPSASLAPNRDGSGLPAAPGIYFLWKGDVVEYVGKSIRLCNRVKLGIHHVLTEEHRISYIFIKDEELTWAECHYIGALRPYKNFGSQASHYKGET